MSKQAFEKKIQELESARSSPAALRKALGDRNNYYVSKAAALAAELASKELIPDLLAAFTRFLTDPVKSDPQCWAKNAIVKTLVALGHDDPEVFVVGIKHIQMEPVYGGRADTATTLRGTCALALASSSMDRAQILSYLVDLLADSEKPARVDAARAIAQLPGYDAALLLRLKVLTGDREPEVTGQCFSCLLDLEPRDYIPFVAGFLKSKDEDIRLEAVSALGECHDPEALTILIKFFPTCKDHEVRRALLLSLGAARHSEAADFLLTVIAEARTEEAATAVASLASSRFREDYRDRVESAVHHRADQSVQSAFDKAFPRR